MMPNPANTLDVAQLPRFYDDRYSGKYCREHGRRHMAQLSTMLGSVPNSCSCRTVLDYGCGSGGCVELLSEFFPEAKIHGVDISNEAIRTARTRFPHGTFASFDGSRTSYPDESFDVIFSSHVLEHVLDFGRCVEDISRLVKPGGYFCVTLPCANNGSLESNLTLRMHDGLIKSATGEDKWFWEDPSHLRRMRSENLVAAFSSCGLRLQHGFFGNQFWGGIEGVCACGPGLILDWLNISRGRDLGDKASLFFAKAILLLLSPVFLAKVQLREKACRSNGVKKFFYLAATPVKVVYAPVAKWLSALADKEWETQRQRSNGASQFLVFRKVKN